MKHLPINTPEFTRHLAEFGAFVRLKGYGRGKNTGYASNAQEFLFFAESKGITSIKLIKAPDVVAYYEYLRERPNLKKEGGLSESMIRGHLFALRLFFDFLLDTGEVNSSPAHLPKFNIGQYKQREILSVEEVKELKAKCRTKLEAALLTIAYGCGLRRSEIAQLDTGDVLLQKGLVLVRDGKYGKSRTVPITDEGIRTLREYLINERPALFPNEIAESTQAFFITSGGTRMRGEKLNGLLKELIDRTGNAIIMGKEITLHCLRHSIATHLLDNGADIEFVQEFLGHSEIDTSHHYSKLRKKRLSMYNEINRPQYANDHF
jgi:integrase/recombinase XerD